MSLENGQKLNLTVQSVLTWSALFSSLAVLLAATESWAIRDQYGPTGVLSTTVLRRIGETSRRTRSRRNLSVRVNIPAALIAEIVSASTVVLVSSLFLADAVSIGGLLWLSILIASIANLVVGVHTPAGQDGADQMASIVLVACAIGLTPGLKPVVGVAAVWFIALQSCLAYATAGIAKLVSREWRSGEAALLVFRTSSYGTRWIRYAMSRYHFLPMVMCFAVIAGECLLPVMVFLGGPFLLVALAWGVSFHVAVVAVMRLNTFVLAFPATYFALYFVGY